MNQIIVLCLGMVLLAFFIPCQVHSQTTQKYNTTGITLAGQNLSVPLNTSGAFPVTTSTKVNATRGHADSLSSSSALFLSVASIWVLNVCC
ncbi:hypothetical protein GDO81_008030 [Engystomops pustulosus]|uniref:Uncharacterized protein n=1 Tax=Engystomops pustulosus TaxID=76066 RepID=A0AAV7CBN8_ENGPU|nr:hypothetical protein GDO81_008030 [Engystomops pustulosus]